MVLMLCESYYWFLTKRTIIWYFYFTGKQQFLNASFSSQTTGACFSHNHVLCLVSFDHSEQRVLLFKVNNIITAIPLKLKLTFTFPVSLSKFKSFATTSILVTYYTYLKECSNNNKICTVLKKKTQLLFPMFWLFMAKYILKQTQTLSLFNSHKFL